MRLYNNGANQNLLVLKDGTSIYFSYDTPVCGFSSKHGYFKTKIKYSVTTSKHMNSYLQGRNVMEVDQEWIDNLLNEQ